MQFSHRGNVLLVYKRSDDCDSEVEIECFLKDTQMGLVTVNPTNPSPLGGVL